MDDTNHGRRAGVVVHVRPSATAPAGIDGHRPAAYPMRVLVYVHGSGHQDPPDLLHERLDRILYGAPHPTTRLAYYAHVLHAEHKPNALSRLRAAAPHRRAAATVEQKVGEVEDAVGQAVTDATIAVAVAAAHPTHEQLDALEDLAPTEEERGRIRALRKRIQVHEDRAISDRPSWLEREAFRVLLGTLLPDVGAYFFGGRAEAMREPLRAVLRDVRALPAADRDPLIVVSHSLGTVITYHVLQEAEFAGLEVDHWITLGSPLGIDEVRWLATRGLPHPAPIPPTVRRWSNFADPLDPVALDGTLRDEFGPADRLVDLQVSIESRTHHAMKAYLATHHVRTAVLGDEVAARDDVRPPA